MGWGNGSLRAFAAGVSGRIPQRLPGGRVLLCLTGRTEGLRWHQLSEIEKPGSGTEPIHREHRMCSRFRGSCPSDVKSVVHPEPDFPISLSCCSAALCSPRETQKDPAAGKPLRNPTTHPSRKRPEAAIPPVHSCFGETRDSCAGGITYRDWN